MNFTFKNGSLDARLSHATKRLLLGVAATGLLVATSCSDMEEDPQASMTMPFTFYVQTSSQQATRGYQGPVGNTGDEGKINTLKVWLFDHETQLLLAYDDSYTDNGTDGLNSNNDVKKVTLAVPQYIARLGRNVDLYVIANAASAGTDVSSLNAGSTPAMLEAALLGGDYFTPANPTKAVPSSGLPYTAIRKDWNILETVDGTNKVRENLEKVTMTRAVSKVKFAFSRAEDNTGVQVVGIVLDGNQIASNEYLFPKDNSNTADYASPYCGDLQTNLRDEDCESAALTFGSTDGSSTFLNASDILVSDDPASLSWANNRTMSAQQYNNLIDTSIYNATTVYLRESKKKLTGTIYYRTASGGDIFAKTFSMEAENDFVRNHSWIVYGYFIGHRLVLEAYVVPWYYWLATTDYTENVSMTKQLAWSNYQRIEEEQEMTIGGLHVNCKIVVLRSNGSAECSFIFDTPYHGTWVALLETFNDTQEDAIVFADGTTVQTGSVGSEATLTIMPRNTTSTTNHYSRLRFVCYSESGEQSYAVGSEVLGGNYVVAQYAN